MLTSILSWILTYAVHSTALIATVWLLCKLFPRLSLATQEMLWKVALVGGIATASIHLGVALEPPWGDLGVPAALRSEPEPGIAADGAAREVSQHRAGDLTITTIRERRPVAGAPAHAGGSPWPWVILIAVGLGSAYALARLIAAALRLRGQLQGRRDVIEDPVLETFLALCQKAGLAKRVRLTASTHLRSPVALPRREICIPERAIETLGPRQQEGMLAHELAHIVRRDPPWLVAASTIEALLFFQPLNHVVRRKIQEVAEFQCDDWASRHVGTGVHLAKCLAEVAAWVDGGGTVVPVVAPMADEGSPIVRRITRLLDDARLKRGEAAPALRVAACLGLLGLVTWLVPGVSRAGSSPAATPARASASEPVVFEELPASPGIDRSGVRVDSGDEVVRVEVERPRAVPPPPPVMERERERERDGGLRIRIQGRFTPFGWDGFVGVDIDDLEGLDQAIAELERDLEGAFGGCGAFDPCDAPGWDEAFDLQLEARAEAYEAAEEAHAEALEAAEQARERARAAHGPTAIFAL